MAKIWTMGELLVEIMRPEADMPLHEADVFKGPYPSGSSAIMITAVARLGVSCGIISGVGKDAFGKCILDRLKRDGVDDSLVVVDENHTTGCAFVGYASDGSRSYIFHWDDTPATMAEAPNPDDERFADTEFFHIMGCALTAKLSYGDEIVKAVRAMREKGIKISFDPNVRVEHLTNPDKSEKSFEIIRSILRETSVFEPGVEELKIVTGADTIEEGIRICSEQPYLDTILLKMGDKGSRVYLKDGTMIDQPLYSVPVVDATGAGDTSDAAFLCSLIEGRPIEECARRAAAAGALGVMAFGPMEGDISAENVDKMIAGTYL